jgi:hypothetical protein
MTQGKYAKLTAALIAVWFATSTGAAELHWLNSTPGKPPLPLLVAVLAPIAVFAAWYLGSKGFREYVLTLNPETLTILHMWRLAGFVFLALYAERMLPGMMALPAGWGDIAIGATAYLAASRLAVPRHRSSFVLWQLLGVLDLMTAVGLGAIEGTLHPHQMTAASMTMLPLSVIPGFGVPFFLILHIICIAQARRWKQETVHEHNVAGIAGNAGHLAR